MIASDRSRGPSIPGLGSLKNELPLGGLDEDPEEENEEEEV